MQVRVGVAGSMFLLLTACATGPKYHGSTIADSRLRSDTSAIVIGVTRAKSKCQNVDAISMSIVSVPSDLQANAAGRIVGGGETVERWLASACGQNVGFIVTFTPDGQGGTYMTVQAE